MEVCGVDTLKNDAPVCPVCHKPGKKVSPKTLDSLLVSDRRPENLDGYAICLSRDCDIVYFGKHNFTRDDVKVKVWYKEDDPSVPVCYCRNVSADDIVRHVAVLRCCDTLQDIQKHTGANTGKDCLTKNPAGT